MFPKRSRTIKNGLHLLVGLQIFEALAYFYFSNELNILLCKYILFIYVCYLIICY